MIVFVDQRFPTHQSAVRCEVCRGTTELVYRDGKFRCKGRHTGVLFMHNDPYRLPLIFRKRSEVRD